MGSANPSIATKSSIEPEIADAAQNKLSNREIAHCVHIMHVAGLLTAQYVPGQSGPQRQCGPD